MEADIMFVENAARPCLMLCFQFDNKGQYWCGKPKFYITKASVYIDEGLQLSRSW